MPSYAFDPAVRAFLSLGKIMQAAATALLGKGVAARTPLPAQFLYREALKCPPQNQWFTGSEIARSLIALSEMLQEEKMSRWLKYYRSMMKANTHPKTVGVVMAGNIPLVGFHDFMCVLLSGHHFLGKLSSQDAILLPALATVLCDIHPDMKKRIAFTGAHVKNAEAVIATGSNNTARYFEYHYSGIPKIIRKNRHSVAILTGKESDDVLQLLGEDVFAGYGLGCRNVSHVLLPEHFDLAVLVRAWQPFCKVSDNRKYQHNYLYQRATYIVTRKSFTDGGFFLLREHPQPASPVTVVHYSYYRQPTEAVDFVHQHRDQLQCVVAGRDVQADHFETIPFGSSWRPDPWDYADGTDTMEFLLKLK